jgi:hypothetical protein
MAYFRNDALVQIYLGVQELGSVLEGHFGPTFGTKFAYFKEFLKTTNDELFNYNSEMLNLFSVLDENIQRGIYSKSVRFYDVDNNGLTGKYKTTDPFKAARMIYSYDLAILQTPFTTIPTVD